MYVNWLNKTTPDFIRVEALLGDNIHKNHYTNSGPLGKKLEDLFREKLEIEDSKTSEPLQTGLAPCSSRREATLSFQRSQLIFLKKTGFQC